MAYDEVDERAEGNLQITMAHEVLASDRLDNPIISGFVIHVLFGSLLSQELGSLLLEQLFVRKILGTITLESVIGRSLSLLGYQSVML